MSKIDVGKMYRLVYLHDLIERHHYTMYGSLTTWNCTMLQILVNY